MPCSRRTGSAASGDQEQGEAYQGKGGCTGLGDERPSEGGSGGCSEGKFRAKMSCGCHPSAHGGLGSQGAPCASCRHAGDQEMSVWRVGVLDSEGRGMVITTDPLDVTDSQSPLWVESKFLWLSSSALKSLVQLLT